MAAEILAEVGSYDKSVDVWSAGATIYECMVGARLLEHPLVGAILPFWHDVLDVQEDVGPFSARDET